MNIYGSHIGRCAYNKYVPDIGSIEFDWMLTLVVCTRSLKL